MGEKNVRVTVPLAYLDRSKAEIERDLQTGKLNPLEVVAELIHWHQNTVAIYETQIAVLEGRGESLQEQNDALGGTVTRLQNEFGVLEKMLVNLQVENAWLEDRSRTDSLTSVLNRAGYEERLADELSRAQRHNYTLNLLYVDVDRFKPVNDTYGHPAGDKVLQEVAQRMRGVLRKEDAIGRFGGDEFAVIASHNGAGEGYNLGEKVHDAVCNKPVLLGTNSLIVTVSIGVASYRPQEGVRITPQELAMQADEALYEAKRQGRNRVVQYTESLIP